MEDASQVIETIMSNSAGEQDFPVLFDDESILSDGERNAKAPRFTPAGFARDRCRPAR